MNILLITKKISREDLDSISVDIIIRMQQISNIAELTIQGSSGVYLEILVRKVYAVTQFRYKLKVKLVTLLMNVLIFGKKHMKSYFQIIVSNLYYLLITSIILPNINERFIYE